MSAHTNQTELKLIGKLILEGEMQCLTGLHVGAGKGSLEIGGSDNAVVKDAFGRPYVPGSSLRGKIRSLVGGFAADSCLVVKFADAAALDAWYHSPAYQALVPLRDEVMEPNFLVLEEPAT